MIYGIGREGRGPFLTITATWSWTVRHLIYILHLRYLPSTSFSFNQYLREYWVHLIADSAIYTDFLESSGIYIDFLESSGIYTDFLESSGIYTDFLESSGSQRLAPKYYKLNYKPSEFQACAKYIILYQVSLKILI